MEGVEKDGKETLVIKVIVFHMQCPLNFTIDIRGVYFSKGYILS